MAYLGSEIESQVAVAGQCVLDEEGNLAGQANLDRVGQTSSLAEVGQIFEREGQGNRLAELNVNVLLGLVDIAPVPRAPQSPP